MSTVREIETAVSKLSRQELMAFRDWFSEFVATRTFVRGLLGPSNPSVVFSRQGIRQRRLRRVLLRLISN